MAKWLVLLPHIKKGMHVLPQSVEVFSDCSSSSNACAIGSLWGGNVLGKYFPKYPG